MEILYLSGLVVALTQVIKKATGLVSRFVPLLAIFLSLLLSYVFANFSGIAMSWNAIQDALIVGLGSVGMWEVGSKSVLGKR